MSTSLPLTAEAYRGKRIDNFLWGLLPDNAVVIGRWADSFRVSSGNPFGLLANVGKDVAGAVTFMEDQPDPYGGMRPISPLEIAERISAIDRDPAAWSGPEDGRFSLAGAQGKFALRYEDGQWYEPSGTEPTTHIFKPRMQGLQDQEINEHLALVAASKMGLPAARSVVAQFGDFQAIVLERYDRARVGGVLHRLHQEDLCQAKGIHPNFKYQSDGGPGAVDAVQLIRKVSTNPDADVWTFTRALAYNYAIWGTDAHAKNYSLLLSGDNVGLAPLYDVNSYLPYMKAGPEAKPVKLAMHVGGEYRLRALRRKHWEAFADKAGLDADEVVSMVRDMVANVPQAFAEAVAEEPRLSASSPLPARLAGLVEKRSRLQNGDDIWPGVPAPAIRGRRA